MKIRIFLLTFAAALLLFTSCRTSEIAYIHDATRDSLMYITGSFSSGIQPNDQLYIYVESEEAGASIPFNQETNKVAVKDGAVLNTTSGATKVQGYLVNQDGVIVFPVLGELEVQGLTHHELAEMIKDRLISEGLLKNPTVTVKLMKVFQILELPALSVSVFVQIQEHMSAARTDMALNVMLPH